MILDHTLGLFLHPDSEWEAIRREDKGVLSTFLTHTPVLAAIPCIASYYGVTQVGWSVGGGELVKLEAGSALVLAVISYMALIAGVFIFGRFIDWMADVYGGDERRHCGEKLAIFVTAPVFVASAVAAYPVLWLDMLVVTIAGCYSVYLIYEGIPILMQIPKEQGFMYASSVLTVGLILTVVLIITTVLIWAMGFDPVFLR